MKVSKSTFGLLSFVAIVIGFFFIAASLFDDSSFITTRNAVIGVGWFLVALWCQHEAD